LVFQLLKLKIEALFRQVLVYITDTKKKKKQHCKFKRSNKKIKLYILKISSQVFFLIKKKKKKSLPECCAIVTYIITM